MRLKLLQCGDFHLDAPFTSLSDMEGRPDKRRKELKETLSRVVETAAAETADIILICGDLYEHGYIRKSTIQYVKDQFMRFPDIQIVMIPGNHDPCVTGSYYTDFMWPSNVHVLADDTLFYEHPSGARIYGALPPDGKLDGSVINILMLHGTLDMPFSTDAFRQVTGAELDAYGFDYCALGHFHSRIYGAGGLGRIFNAGSPEPLGFDEEGEHGVIIAEISKASGIIKADFVRLCKRRFFNLDVQISGCAGSEQAAMLLAAAMEKAGSPEDLYRLFVYGYRARDFRMDTGLITEMLKERAFYIKIIDRTVPDYDFGRIAEEPGLRGLFVRKMLDRAMAAASGQEKELVMQALYYGMEAIDEGRVCI